MPGIKYFHHLVSTSYNFLNKTKNIDYTEGKMKYRGKLYVLKCEETGEKQGGNVVKNHQQL